MLNTFVHISYISDCIPDKQNSLVCELPHWCVCGCYLLNTFVHVSFISDCIPNKQNSLVRELLHQCVGGCCLLNTFVHVSFISDCIPNKQNSLVRELPHWCVCGCSCCPGRPRHHLHLQRKIYGSLCMYPYALKHSPICMYLNEHLKWHSTEKYKKNIIAIGVLLIS